ncbi:MAG: DUF3352 domain-containing protein, partial [Candidatus Omnitrophica bacterium]|nr:DUF3352 domain-containing protein [Candidatus Omnitrophota bacterium]
KNLEGIDIEHLLKESDVPDDVIKEYGKYKDMSEGLPAELLLDDYFGKEILLAVYPPKTTKEQADSWERLKSSVVLVTRIKTGAKVFNFFTGIFKDIGGEIVIESDKFLDHKITTVIVTDEISLFFAEIENLMILALDKNTVQECLKVAKGKKSSLAQEAIYKETMDGLPSGADTYIYADCKGYVDLLSDIMILANSYFINNLDSDKSEFSSVLKQQMGKSIQGFKSFGYASTIGKNSEAKSVVLIDNDKLNTINKIVFAQRPAVSKALKLVPKNCLAFFWFTLNFEQYWQGLKEQIEENQAFTQIGEDVKQDQQKMGIDELVKQFQNKTGIDIENQLFSALGSDAAIIVNDFDAEGSIPLPEITVLCRINDKAEMEKIIKALLKDSKIDLSAKTVKGGKIEYIALPFGTNLQPGYAFFED